MSKAKVVVCGALGRMGRMVTQAVLKRDDLELFGLVEYPACPQIGQKAGPLLGLDSLDITLKGSLKEAGAGADVYIDFTSIESSLAYLKEAEELGLAAVIGTTGLSEAERGELKKSAARIPVLWAPNMSIGVNVMYKIAAAMARALGPDFDLEIVEAHHNQKKDAPSGTAMKLYENLAEARSLDRQKSLVSGREGQVGARSKDEIGVLAVRGGDIVGDHTVYFCGPGERLELVHRAQTRETFAQGAVRAAAWLAAQKPGLYAVEDSLSLDF